MSTISQDHFVRIKEVKRRTGLGHSSIYRKIKEGTFPPGHSLGTRARGWLNSEVEAWIASQIASSPEVEPWTPPPLPARRVAEKKLPPLVPNEKGAEAAAKIAGVIGLAVADDQPPSDQEIALRCPDWPEIMRQRTAAAYLDLSRVCVHQGSLPGHVAQPSCAWRAAVMEPTRSRRGACTPAEA